MNPEEFRKNALEVVEWMTRYMEEAENYPVKPKVSPGAIYSSLPDSPPMENESFDNIMNDFSQLILPGMTHWQSPGFYAYFPANASPPSILAEMITATLGAQCMMWETSPAATELEEKVMDWLKEMIGLPKAFHGVIQDTASTATLVAILSARERITEFQSNEIGFLTNRYRIYCSTEAHSSVEKAVKIAGFGKQNLVKIETGAELAMKPEKLEEAIREDIQAGLIPVCVVAALGTTGTCSFDPLATVAQICNRFHVWLHVDAAYAGTAFILPEYRHYMNGVEHADSFVFNPHKWMFTNFDCTAYFVKSKESLVRSFEIMPEYLKTKNDKIVNNYRDWGIQLGRRFRALKLWFVIRSMGTEGIRRRIRSHIEWAGKAKDMLKAYPGIEVFEPQNMGLVCFRYVPSGKEGLDVDAFNREWLSAINDSGRLYLSHTMINKQFFLRMSIGQTNASWEHAEKSLSFMTGLLKDQ